MQEDNRPDRINIKASDDKLKGEYSNVLHILHTKEEFILDFLSVLPPTGALNARIVVSPLHFKRMLKAMEDNLKKYESSYGKVLASEEPAESIGFQMRESD